MIAVGFGSEIHMVSPELTRHLTGMAVTAGLGLLGWIGKYFLGLIVDEWRDTKKTISSIHQIAQVQAENHLSTIQVNTGKTNEILEKMAAGQSEMNGWLKGRLQ